ncbi:MAG TPA: hypothetical protein VL993_13385 [Stellaceae bacterium]|nr:hypothetical protein [Stellaceae bacterium]
MSQIPPFTVPPRVPAVEPSLLGSAIFLFGEYLARLEAETPSPEEEVDDEDEDGGGGIEIETGAVLDLFAEELGTGVAVTLTLYLRVTALYRLLSRSPSLARLAMDQEEWGGTLTEDAMVAAARLDLHVTRKGEDGTADFDPREFRDALISD